MKHTDESFGEQLELLKESILKMGSEVESMIVKATQSLVKRDSHLAREVIASDQSVNRLEMEVDDLCLRTLARYQPAASDLRFVTVGLKISTDLERIGDLAVNICEQTLELNQEEPLKPYLDLPRMAEKTEAMLKGALDAFVERDSVKAKQIMESDDEVDELNRKIFAELTKMMENSPQAIGRAIRLLSISRHLERVADHATNIAEDVTFLVKGKDVRHGA